LFPCRPHSLNRILIVPPEPFYQHKNGDERMGATWKKPFRYILYNAIVIAILMFAVENSPEFIYFQF
ncbi:hypothetical protein, partial [Candidatus Symbiothrix dinenymphae]|uniref:hypothetical protein n=1 Tax=Candidatus Symbiothrix dinenymphae TaxID=467085 RepID=UPI000AA51F8A